MANHKSALKRIRSSEKKRQQNRIVLSRTRTELKKARIAISEGNLDEARAAAKLAVRTLDKAATKGVLHANNVARHKSHLMKALAAREAAK